jgi:hypothetical protein
MTIISISWQIALAGLFAVVIVAALLLGGGE